MPELSLFDHQMMALAINLAKKGQYSTSPNPNVGCVIVKGEEIIVEYFEPYYTNIEPKLVIGSVNHDFIGFITESGSIPNSFGNSGPCQVDVNCVEGSNWQTEKRSVCKILMNGTGLCSGALMNNTNFDGRSYFLTANHCICNATEANNSLFIFNYESPTCGGGDGSTSHCISGATLRATRAATDFSLLELSLKPPAAYNPHYAGWDRSNTATQGGVGIHHPSGDVKKISTHNITPVTSTCMNFNHDGGCGTAFYPNNNFWRVHPWSATTNGQSVTEGGSSGSPLFNNDRRVIGQLFGAGFCPNNNCSNPNNDWANYGKIWASWDMGGTAGSQLQNWLDPSNSPLLTLNGVNICPDGVLDNLTFNKNTVIKAIQYYGL